MPAYPYPVKGGRRWRYQFEANGQGYSKRGFTREREALDAETQRRAEVLQGYGKDGRTMTFEAFVQEDYLLSRRARVKDGTLRSSSLRQIKSDLRCHLLPAFGKRPLGEIDVRDAERFGNQLTEQGLSASTVKRAMLTGGSVFKLAVKYRRVPYNPFTDADKPSPRPCDDPIPTLEEVYALADATPNAETRALVLCLAFTGMRKAEAFGLRWANVDLTEGQELARIVEQVYQGEWVDRLKTKAGCREIVLALVAAELLRELSVRQQVDDRPNPHGLVFPSPRGEPWLHTNWDRRVWMPARKAAGLPEMKLKTLRSFYVSMVRAQDLPLSISEQLTGHADEATHRRYTRPIVGMEPRIRAALGAAFAPEENPS